MLFFLRKIIPKSLLQAYHFTLAVLAAFYYHFPANKMVVIGVTGTGGKSTTVMMIGRILEEAGWKVGWSSSLTLKIGKEERLNPFHMTMLGRFKLQRLLATMVKRGIQIAIIEVTSEGIKQYRHFGINFDIAVFTNLSREHIEAHGSYENYRAAKGKLFKKVGLGSHKRLKEFGRLKKTIVVNVDDKESDYFLNFPAEVKIGYSLKGKFFTRKDVKVLAVKNFKLREDGSQFILNGTPFELKLLGEFNIYNALAAIATTRALNVDYLTAKKALAKITQVPGRMEIVKTDKGFNVVIDLAHTPDSLRQAYQTLKKAYFLVPGLKNMICVFGSAGGLRDKWKRPVLGKIAASYCDFTFLTNEDPYDENPLKIIKEIAQGLKKEGKKENKDFWIIPDRREAIRAALKKAKKGDLVVITGKGTEATMVIGSQTIPWNEKAVVEQELEKI